jgi:hypothetical protein
MSESEPKIDSNIADEIKKRNLIREKAIRSETEKVKKFVDLILKIPKQITKKIAEKTNSSQEKKTDKSENPKEQKVEKK